MAPLLLLGVCLYGVRIQAAMGMFPPSPLPPKNSPAMKMMYCEACNTVMGGLAKDVKYLLEAQKMWKAKDLKERIMVSCQDPAVMNGFMKDTCASFLTEYRDPIAKETALRWTEDSDEFDEDIVPKEFCMKLGVCKEGHQSLNQMLHNAQVKEDALKKEKEEKEKKR
mmetsp:Transcript_123998/g.246908  ORF Transcript_123998/g.246908 Transcript_123998/m.246908 type:complete len:167 (-) Transcript_123998:149-649(-)|eukprot:CAMPEP_0172698656 /NCGR_PEP_ID=MMETSP1074-20121228/29632_1 /TAXON_ID=2916 /ORGANISM="Ceratium fusus, Strain PA161109" /LENGTH=166 /DNA_ID=CAMNT_0013519731 /DNA_START=30 /DNA_END=530 /DNA_ORIENTATION=-